ncbi:hypothetical protein D3C87_832440 [compost metagenome]
MTSLKPASTKVGTSGNAPARCGSAMASTRTLPDLMIGRPEARSSIIVGTWPPITSVMAGAAPLYGTCVIVRPAFCLNSSIAMWCGEPLPGEA